MGCEPLSARSRVTGHQLGMDGAGRHLPPALASFPAYVASGFDPNSPAARTLRAAGYPPDLVSGTASLFTELRMRTSTSSRAASP